MKPKKTVCAQCQREVFLADARIKMVDGSLQWVHHESELCSDRG